VLKSPAIRLAVLGIALVGTAAAWYLIAPLFTGSMAYSVFPTIAAMPTRTPRPATATPLPTEPPAPTAAPLLQSSASLLVAQGNFYEVAHTGQGQADVYLTESGSLLLNFSDFEVEDGPELHVYLASQNPIENTEGVALEGAIDLGLLQNITGEQMYILPAGLDLTQYSSVVIWCEPYLVPFIAASLQAP
jgi:hypothetical protein